MNSLCASTSSSGLLDHLHSLQGSLDKGIQGKYRKDGATGGDDVRVHGHGGRTDPERRKIAVDDRQTLAVPHVAQNVQHLTAKQWVDSDKQLSLLSLSVAAF